MIEFKCCECGRAVVAVVENELRVPPLCSHCIWIPAWYEDPALVRIIDPERRA